MATMNINWKPGQSIIYAGTPIDEDGNIANNSNAVALVVSDTLNPNAAEVITEGTWDEETNYHGITISDDCKRALPGIEFVGSDGEQHPATSLPTPKSDDAGKSAVVNEQGNAYALGAGGGGGLSLVSGGGINITWDGSTEGRDVISLEAAGANLYKVSNSVFDNSELIDSVFSYTAFGQDTIVTLDENTITEIGTNCYGINGALAISGVAGEYSVEIEGDTASFTIPSDGTYFLYVPTPNGDMMATSITKTGTAKLMQNGEDVTETIASLILGYAD